MALFNFKLKPFAQCAFPFYSQDIPDSKSVCWFWLTDSDYYIQLDTFKFYESSNEWKIKYPIFQTEPFLDYHFVRFLEDFFDLLPNISHPMPEKWLNKIDTLKKLDELYNKMSDIPSRDDPDDYDNAEDFCRDFYNRNNNDLEQLLWDFSNIGNLDSCFLSQPPIIRFTHYQDKILIDWDCTHTDSEGDPAWAGGVGRHTIPYTDFLLEIEDLLNRFFEAMDNQIEQIQQYLSENPTQTKYYLYDNYQQRDTKQINPLEGIQYLQKEHQERKDFFYSILTKMKNNEYPSFPWGKLEQAWKFFEMDNKKG
jgi:hypothetical protein